MVKPLKINQNLSRNKSGGKKKKKKITKPKNVGKIKGGKAFLYL